MGLFIISIIAVIGLIIILYDVYNFKYGDEINVLTKIYSYLSSNDDSKFKNKNDEKKSKLLYELKMFSRIKKTDYKYSSKELELNCFNEYIELCKSDKDIKKVIKKFGITDDILFHIYIYFRNFRWEEYDLKPPRQNKFLPGLIIESPFLLSVVSIFIIKTSNNKNNFIELPRGAICELHKLINKYLEVEGFLDQSFMKDIFPGIQKNMNDLNFNSMKQNKDNEVYDDNIDTVKITKDIFNKINNISELSSVELANVWNVNFNKLKMNMLYFEYSLFLIGIFDKILFDKYGRNHRDIILNGVIDKQKSFYSNDKYIKEMLEKNYNEDITDIYEKLFNRRYKIYSNCKSIMGEEDLNLINTAAGLFVFDIFFPNYSKNAKLVLFKSTAKFLSKETLDLFTSNFYKKYFD